MLSRIGLCTPAPLHPCATTRSPDFSAASRISSPKRPFSVACSPCPKGLLVVAEQFMNTGIPRCPRIDHTPPPKPIRINRKPALPVPLVMRIARSRNDAFERLGRPAAPLRFAHPEQLMTTHGLAEEVVLTELRPTATCQHPLNDPAQALLQRQGVCRSCCMASAWALSRRAVAFSTGLHRPSAGNGSCRGGKATPLPTGPMGQRSLSYR